MSKSNSTLSFNKYVSNSITCDSRDVTLTSEMYNQLVKLLNSQKVVENVKANMASVLINCTCVKTSFVDGFFILVLQITCFLI